MSTRRDNRSPGTRASTLLPALGNGTELIDATHVFGDVVDDAPTRADREHPLHVVHFDRSAFDSAHPGDVLLLRLPLLDARERLKIIDAAGEIDRGRVLRGRFLDASHPTPSTLTLGPDRVYGTLVASGGVLELEGRDGLAWLHRVPRQPTLRQRAWLLPRRHSDQAR